MMTRHELLKRTCCKAVLAGSLVFSSALAPAWAQDAANDSASAAASPASGLLSSMQVTPLRIDLPGASNAEIVNVRNSTSGPMAIQVRLFAWNQQAGEESYSPSNDLMITPSIVSIPAGQTQILRVLRKSAASQGEKRYRLVIDQLPDPALAKAQAAQTRLRFALPVFVDSDKTAPAKFEWQLSDGALKLTNTGGAAARIVHIDVKGADGRTVPVEENSLRYVFGANAISWPIGKGCSFAKVRVTAEIDGRTVDAEPTATCG